MIITRDRLAVFAPDARADIVAALADPGDELLRQAAMVPPLRLPHFLAQIATETGGFAVYVESGNYTAENLAAAWDAGNWHRYFSSRSACIAMAEQCRVDHGEALFNLVYSDRMGNGPPSSGDGWRYRGRGLIQTTGRELYRRAGHEADPEALADPAIGLVAAIDEFVRAGCLALADADDVVGVRRRINGGLNGIDQCRAFLSSAKRIFNGDVAASPAVPVTAAVPYADAVKEIQRGLRDMGLYGGEIDGAPGPKTRAATDAFRAKI